MSITKLDLIDHQLLEILQQNAKITNAQLSKEIGLSPAPTLERVKKLEALGIIQSYHAQLNRDKVGLGVTTFVTVTLTGHKKQVTESFVNQINQIPEVIECHHVTGAGDFMLKIISKDISTYQKLMLEKINEKHINIEAFSGKRSLDYSNFTRENSFCKPFIFKIEPEILEPSFLETI
jgi:DNA-binding Lrp family transcriptional regulator